MKKIIELLKKNIESITVEIISTEKGLLAHKLGAKMVVYREECLPLNKVSINPDYNDNNIDDTVYMLNPLQDEFNLINDAKLLLIGLLSETVFSGKLDITQVKNELSEFYQKNKNLFPELIDYKCFMCWQLKTTIIIFSENLDDVIRYADLLLKKEKLTFKEDLSEEFASPEMYCL